MIKKIFGTFGTRLLNALVGFVTLWFGTNFLGREAWGIGATVLVDVSLLLIAVELLSGSGLIYFTPRKSFSTIFRLSHIWILLITSAICMIFYLLSFFPRIYHSFVPEGYGIHIVIMVFLYSLHNFNMNVLLGKERVMAQNVLFIIQFMTQLISMIIYIFVFKIRNANAFVYSLITGYFVVNILGFLFITPYFKDKSKERESLVATAKEMLSFGSMIQLSTLVTMINRRISYIVIKNVFGDADVGVYTSGTQVSEATKLIGNSIALVQFSTLSNMDDKDKAAAITVTFLKLAVIATAVCMLLICLIPKAVFAWIFTEEFVGIKDVLVSLTPGMVFLSADMIFSHYFSGVNKPKYNLYGTLVGFAITIPSIVILIPMYGIVGAGISVSLTYFGTILYQWLIFKKLTGTKTIELVPTLNDFKTLINSIKSQLFKHDC
ncbi:MAG: polysaccharide biosynthesis C-terminal domain-containing protein [Bacteroidales bacterium]|nr:polysaccharide biosynthesis C-terminal domain-containing protein [Bacteroidales bacterium]